MDSIPHLYNILRPQSWEEIRPYANEKFIPAPLTVYSADRLTAIGLVWIKSNLKLSLLGLHAHCLQSGVPPGADLIQHGVVLLNAAGLVLVTLNCALLPVQK